MGRSSNKKFVTILQCRIDNPLQVRERGRKTGGSENNRKSEMTSSKITSSSEKNRNNL